MSLPRWKFKSIGTLTEVENAKASKKKDKENVQQGEIEACDPLSRENLTISSNKTYILPDRDFLLVADDIQQTLRFVTK